LLGGGSSGGGGGLQDILGSDDEVDQLVAKFAG
jgi:hypothetical protein